MAFVKIILLPLSVIYGVVTGARNFLFHIGVLKSQTFRVPVICVGNITVGGTGKTPHTELIISELKKKFRVACLSRGYKRKTRGFILANEHSTAAEIGDEPMQIKSKYPDILVACDGNRVRGIQKLLALPAGRLRESVQALKRADYIIVTKCPKSIQPIEKRILSKHLKIKPYQQLFFTTLEYGKIKPLFPQYESIVPDRSSSILCLTGIAQPGPYIDHLKTFTSDITEIRYPDHHHFSKKDFQQIARAFESIENPKKYIFTTEKDAVRLKACPLPEELQRVIYYIPVEPVFIDQDDLLLNEISEYVRKNQR